MHARRLILVTMVSLCVLAGGLSFSVAPGWAFIAHQYLSQLTGFRGPAAVAVDSSSDVYVADEGARVVDRVGPSGAPLLFSASEPYVEGAKLKGTPTGAGGVAVPFSEPTGVAVDDTSGDVYVSDAGLGVVDVFASTGEFLRQLTGTPVSAPVSGAFGRPTGLAFDSSTGDVYVADAGRCVVDVFGSSGVYVSQLGSGVLECFGSRLTVAVNHLTGNVYVGEQNPEGVDVFEGLGAFLAPRWGLGGEFNTGLFVGLDQFTGHVYVAGDRYGGKPGIVAEFGASTTEELLGDVAGTPAGAFSNNPVAVATNPVNGDLYVVEGNVVDVFGPDLLVPDVTTGPFSETAPASAKVSGTVNPDGLAVTGCEFEYGTTTTYGHSRACVSNPGSGSSAVEVSAQLSGLAPNTTYHYRLLASNANGEHEGGDGSFTTPGPPAIVSESSEVNPLKAGQTAVTLQASINPGQRTTEYTFEYGEPNHYGTSIPIPAGEIAAGETPVGVSGEATGLTVGTTYHYRVVSHNEYGTIDGPDQTVTTTPAAVIEGEWSTGVHTTSATLHAKINPIGTSTAYHFEYWAEGEETDPTTVPVLDEPVGSGETGIEVEQHLQGLTAGETYRYRVIVTNALEKVPGEIQGQVLAFTTQIGGEAGLPDGRQWELVSPPDKQGARLVGVSGSTYVQAAAAGNGVFYGASAPTERLPHGDEEATQVLSRQGAGAGWTSVDLNIPHVGPSNFVGLGYWMFSTDLALAAYQHLGTFQQALSPAATEGTAYLRENATGSFTPLVTGCTPEGFCRPDRNDTTEPFVPFGSNDCPSDNTASCGPEFEGATPSLDHVVLASAVPLLAGEAQGGLYEWSAGTLAPVSGVSGGGATVNLGNGGIRGESPRVVRHAVSNDGTRIFWTKGVENRGGPLFVTDMTSHETLEVGGTFEGANAQGTLVFHSGSECEVVVGKAGLECRPVEREGKPAEDGTVLASSEDGSWVYFQKEHSIYVRHGGAAAKLVASDAADIQRQEEGAVRLKPIEDPWRASPNGEWFAFMSTTPLTGYDNRDAVTGVRDEEVYLYNAVGERLVCASCDPTGARPRGAPYLGVELATYGGVTNQPVAATVPGWGGYGPDLAMYDSRFLSDSGRLFFNATDGLVPLDVNGKVDVYEFEPPGVGSCRSATHTGADVYSPAAGGCVALISNGEAPEESVFEDASETGEDVFFLSSARLTSEDLDGTLSMWDAHVCRASSPCPPAPAAQVPPCNNESSCRPSLSPQPSIFGAPASATFSGQGNASSLSTGRAVKPKKALTRARGRARALRACGREMSKRRRKRCEASAGRRFGAERSGVSGKRRG